MESERRLPACRICDGSAKRFRFPRRSKDEPSPEKVGAAGVAAPTTYVLL
jgi:hypothetical protein